MRTFIFIKGLQLKKEVDFLSVESVEESGIFPILMSAIKVGLWSSMKNGASFLLSSDYSSDAGSTSTIRE